MNNPPNPLSVSIPNLPTGWYQLSYTVLAGNRLGILGTDEDIHSAFKKDAASARSLSAKACAKIWIFDGDGLYETISFPLLQPFPMIDQFPDGSWLVVNSRSRGNKSARILLSDGTEKRRIELGDGIEHVKIDKKSRIWVGWFDEGVFGNDNWQYPGLRWPPSSNGIAAFNHHGELVQNASLSSIADCYALNVFSNEAWYCTYTDFPISQINASEENVWNSQLSGVRAIAISYPYVLTAGGYGENINCISLVKLTKDKAVEHRAWKTKLISKRAEIRLLDGRADIIHLVTSNKWHRWNVAQCLA